MLAGGARIQSASTFRDGLPFAVFAKGGPLFVCWFAGDCWGGRVPRIDFNESFAAIVEGPTAPGPVARVADQRFSNGVGMHIVKFFEQFRAGIDVEIVVAALPETAQEILPLRKMELQLVFRVAFPSSHSTRQPLLEDLNDFGGRSRSRLGDEQMQVLGHDDVADDTETIAGADFLENLRGQISGASGSEKRSSLIAAERDEVKIAAPDDALKIFGHRRKEGPTLCPSAAGRQRAQRVGHPGRCFYH